MGFIQGCNMCNIQKEMGELKADNFSSYNKENEKAKNAFEIRIKHNGEALVLSEKNISKIITHINKSANNIEFPTEILDDKSKNTFKTDIIQFKNGDRFQGYLNEHFKREGFGTYIKQNGYIYKGLWKNNEIGDYICIVDPKGNYFKGKFENNKIDGDGEIILNKILKYKGNFSNNIPNKKGIVENYINCSNYEGELINGKMNGKGIIKFKDGTIYKGNFCDNHYEGFGNLILPNGNIYEGNFYKNVFNGKGKYIYKDGKIYEGEFQMGFKYGFGKLIWNPQKYFEGYWINNRPHGEGVFYNNGKKLKGLFRYGKLIMKLDQESLVN